MVDLKNCPFCGGKATLYPPYGALGAWISCAGCGLEGPTETGVTAAEAVAAWNRRALQAVGPEPAVAGVETCKFYHSQWPVEDRLKARGPYGLITDDGEAWRYEYTHSDADGGPYDVVCRPCSALVATPPAERVVEAQIKHMVQRFLQWKLPENFNPDGGVSFDKSYRNPHGPVGTNLLDYTQAERMVRHMLEGLPALATQPAVKDDETVVEALRGATASLVAAVFLLKRGSKKAAPSDKMFDQMILDYEKSIEEARAALAAKDGRS